MVKQDFTKPQKIGDSRLVRIPATLMKDEAFPFERKNFDNSQLLMEITKDNAGRPGLFIRKP